MVPAKVSLKDLEWEILTENHDLSDFDCSNGDKSGVNEFIHSEAKKYQFENMGTTYLFYHDSIMAGFATLSMNSIRVKECPDKGLLDWFGKKRPPVVLLGQLGVGNNFRRRSLATVICDFCTGIAADLSQTVGCRYLVLHADLQYISLYNKCGFEIVDSTSEDGLMVKKFAHLVYVQDLELDKFARFREESEKTYPSFEYQVGPRKGEDAKKIGIYYQIIS